MLYCPLARQEQQGSGRRFLYHSFFVWAQVCLKKKVGHANLEIKTVQPNLQKLAVQHKERAAPHLHNSYYSLLCSTQHAERGLSARAQRAIHALHAQPIHHIPR